MPEETAVTPDPVFGALVSKKKHGVYIVYGGETIMLSPGEVMREVNGDLLGALPRGVVFIAKTTKSEEG